MSYENILVQTLLIPRHHQRWLSKNRAVCLVTEEYLLNWKQGSVKSYGRSRSLSPADAELMLAPSCEVLTKPWIRISVKIIPKSDHLVDRLRDEPLSSSHISSCLAEHLAQVCRENFCNLWTSAAHKFSSKPDNVFQTAQDQFTEVVKKYLLRLLPGFYINLTDKQDSNLHTGSLISSPKNTVPLLGVVDCKEVYLVVQPYLAHSLQNIATYSPALFSRSNAKPLFILYQVLQSMASLHDTGLALGRLSLYNILVDKKLWVYVTVPNVSFIHCNGNQIGQETAMFKIRGSQENENLTEASGICQKKIGHIENETLATEHRDRIKCLGENEQSLADAVEFFHGSDFTNYGLDDLSRITENWVSRKLSNFKYLMILNYLAGRRTGDPNHHPVLPWVTDFSTADGVIRNLKRSKFRLNKGDSQLDFTYETMANFSNNIDHIPHHVSDVLSDITYYVYKARRTPKQILCKYVRSKWVPNEYPVSMQRMYQWTPDECIPEFFTDPTIFTSIHEDLPDLQLPSWCTSSQDFVLRHMNVLESEDVSEKLHHWIDLTFGFKLSGQASVRSKNVYLQLVDQHKNVKNHGVVQLFSHPHPHRLPISMQHDPQPPRFLGTQDLINAENSFDGEVRPETAKIFIPKSFEPLAPLDQFESLHAFTSRAMRILSTGASSRELVTPFLADPHGRQQAVWRDMQNFGCVMCEMFSCQKLPLLQPNTSLMERYRMIQRLCVQDRQTLPRFLQKAAEILLQLDTQLSPKTITQRNDGPLFDYPLINSMGLPPPTPALLLQPYVDILPFPSYFANLYSCLQQLKDNDSEIDKVRMDMSKSQAERRKLIKVTARQKVALLEKYLVKYREDLSEEGYEILLPYVEELFQDPNTTVQAAWSLLNLVGQDLGPVETSKRFLSHLIRIFIGEVSTPKHMKLYHRTFLVQLLLRLGLDTFLTNFSTLLVEATAGYKDFILCGNTGNLEDEEEDETAEEKEEEDVFAGDCHTDVSSIENPLEGQKTIEDDLLEDSRPDIEDNDEPQVEDDIPDEEFGAMWIDGDVTVENIKNNLLKDTKDELSFDSHSSDQASMKSGETDARKDSCQDGSLDRVSIHSISAFLHRSDQPFTAEEESKNSLNEFQQDVDEDDVDVTVFDSDIVVDDADSADDVDEISDVTSENHTSGQIPSCSMIRSETDEFSQIHHTQTINIRDIAAESIKWLSHRLGPLLTAKFLSKNLVRMLALCYLGEEQMERVNQTENCLPHTTYAVVGDQHAVKVLECLSYVACLYGEQVILLQYLPCTVDLVHVSWRRLTVRAEAGLVAALVLMRHMIPLLSDTAFMDMLQESIIKEVILPSLKLLSSTSTTFPSGSLYRGVALFKMVDIIYICGVRLGFEMTRKHMTTVLKSFFKPFSDVYGKQSNVPTSNTAGELKEVASQKSLKSMDSCSIDESYLNIKRDESTQDYIIGSPVTISIMAPDAAHSPKSRGKPLKASYSLSMGHMIEERDENLDMSKSTGENIQLEMRETFSAKLAYAAYIPLTSIFGSHHMEDNVSNDDLIRRLCTECDSSLNLSGCSNNASTSDSNVSDNGSHVEMVGNQICLSMEEDLGINPETRHLRNQLPQSGILRVETEETKCSDIDRNKHRHLRGDWLAYWEHELGLNERDTVFNFKQIKLQTFLGHTNSIRSITVLDNENSFISASKDKTVKLWSLSSFGDGSGKCKYQASYEQHKKSVFSVVYLENIRLVASCDSTVHIWDPFTEHTIRQLDSSKYSPVIALTPLPLPSTVIVTATTDCTLRFLDLRTADYAHEFKCTLMSTGPIRCVTVSPNGSWVAVGFSTGVISVLDLQTGILMSTWKGHDGEIVQMKAYNKNSFVSTSFDMTMKLWNLDGEEICQFKGYSEPIHCVNFYKGQIISATTGNKIGVHTSVDKQANFSSTKLRSETFKGVLTSMAILPLNRTMLLGADNGSIRLLC